MSAPDSALHDPRPEYIRSLIDLSGLTRAAIAARLGISESMVYAYIASDDSPRYRPAPYLVQYALEGLAEALSTSTDGMLG